MVEYRYHRMATNTSGWLGPIPGRLGQSNDYVGSTGFGHEDWNFTKDVWEDGKCHLYVQAQPAQSDRDKTFFIALGERTREGHCLVGFCENATYRRQPALDEETKRKRAKQLHELDSINGLAGIFRGQTMKEKAANLLDDGEIYWICVAANDLIILETPILIPVEIVKKTYNRYGLLKLDQEQYSDLRASISAELPSADQDEAAFPEGALIARTHLHRERNSRLIQQCKNRFVEKHGSLFCEACEWHPKNIFADRLPKNSIIEAHHDVPLKAAEHGGVTRTEDIKMLCPNCHRMIHIVRPWLRLREFRTKFFSRIA